MASEKHDFKPRKPRTYSGKGKDKDSETFEEWKQEVLDYFDRTSMPPSKHIQLLGYFVSNMARDSSDTKRQKLSRRCTEASIIACRQCRYMGSLGEALELQRALQ